MRKISDKINVEDLEIIFLHRKSKINKLKLSEIDKRLINSVIDLIKSEALLRAKGLDFSEIFDVGEGV